VVKIFFWGVGWVLNSKKSCDNLVQSRGSCLGGKWLCVLCGSKFQVDKDGFLISILVCMLY